MRLLLCLILFSKCFSQTTEIDSLRKLLEKNLNDTTKANTLCQLSWLLGDYNANEGFSIGKKALIFSKEKKLNKNTGIAYNCIGYNLNMLGRLHESVQNYHYSINIWYNLNDSLRIARGYSNIGNVYSEIPQFDSAQKYYKKSIDLCIKHNFKKPLSSAYLNLASLYMSKNRFDESIKLLLRSLKIKEELGDNQGVANICSHISAIYKDQKNNIMALKYAKQAFYIWRKMNDINGLSYAKMQLGLVYYKLNKFDSALLYTGQSLSEFEKINNKLSIATGYNQLGLIYSSTEQIAKAISSFETAKKKSTSPFITETYVTSHINLVSLYSKTKDYSKAQINLDTVLRYINTDIQKNTVIDIYKIATDYYKEINDFKKALHYNELYNLLRDSLIKEENFIVTSELQVKFETEKKENENQKLKSENNFKEAELLYANKRQNWILFFTFFAIIALITVFYFIDKANKAKQQLKEQDIINQATFETEQSERTRIARELHDGVGQKLSVVKMQLSINKFNIKATAELLDNAIQEIRNASHNLMPNDINQGLVSAIENLTQQINFSNKIIEVNLLISEDFKRIELTKKTELYIYRIIQEIINNSLKYAHAKHIHISMDCFNSQIQLHLSDDGVGFLIEKMNDGFGLKNIKNRVEQLKGKLSLKSGIDKGTTYNIQIPYDS